MADLKNAKKDDSIIASLTHSDSRYNRENAGNVKKNGIDFDSIKKKLDSVSESAIRDRKILSLLSEISKRNQNENSTDLLDVESLTNYKSLNDIDLNAENSIENMETDATFDTNLGEELEICKDSPPPKKQTTNYEVEFVKKKRIKFISKEQSKTMTDTEKSNFIMYNTKEVEDPILNEEPADFKREYYKDKMRRERLNLIQK